MYELMPSFQESRKTEYTSGKAGIAPFALNSTNHCLTQATHLRMKFSEGASKYNLNQFDEITGQDGYKILLRKYVKQPFYLCLLDLQFRY